MSSTILKIKQLTKCYKKNSLANDKISLKFDQGEIAALVGHNGAGKTTLLNQIIGLVKPTSGEIWINDYDVVKNPLMARRLVSSMPQFQVPIKGVTLYQSIESILRVKGFSKEVSKTRTEAMIRELRIEPWQDLAGEKLSGGLQRLASFAMSVTSDSPILVLDEPTNDVDPERRALMWRYLRRLADSGTLVLIVTHNLLEVEKYADRYILLNQGRVRADQRLSETIQKANRHLLKLQGIQKENTTLLSDKFNTTYKDEEKQMLVYLKDKEVKEALGMVLDLLQRKQIINYDLKRASFLDDYEGMVKTND